MTTSKTKNLSPESVPETTTATPEAASPPARIQGQSAFHVELSPVGVVVRPVFVGDDASLHAAPAAVFANLEQAIHQLDELKRLVLRHFGEAALVGMQVLQQAPQQSQSSSASTDQASQGAVA